MTIWVGSFSKFIKLTAAGVDYDLFAVGLVQLIENVSKWGLVFDNVQYLSSLIFKFL